MSLEYVRNSAHSIRFYFFRGARLKAFSDQTSSDSEKAVENFRFYDFRPLFQSSKELFKTESYKD